MFSPLCPGSSVLKPWEEEYNGLDRVDKGVEGGAGDDEEEGGGGKIRADRSW